MLCLVTKLCPTLHNPMDCSPPGPSVLGDSPGGLPYPPPGDLPNQGSNPGLPHWRWIFYCLSPWGSPRILEWVAMPSSRGSSISRDQYLSLLQCGRPGFDPWFGKIPWRRERLSSVTQSCSTLCDPMDYSVHGILQVTILEWVAFPFSRGSSQTRDETRISYIAGGFFTN